MSNSLEHRKKHYRIYVKRIIDDLSSNEALDSFSVYLPKPFHLPDTGECWCRVSDINLNLKLPATIDNQSNQLVVLQEDGIHLFPHSRIALTASMPHVHSYDTHTNGPTSIIATITNIDDFKDDYKGQRPLGDLALFYTLGFQSQQDTSGFLTDCPFGKRIQFNLIDYATREALPELSTSYLHELSFVLEVEFM